MRVLQKRVGPLIPFAHNEIGHSLCFQGGIKEKGLCGKGNLFYIGYRLCYSCLHWSSQEQISQKIVQNPIMIEIFHYLQDTTKGGSENLPQNIHCTNETIGTICMHVDSPYSFPPDASVAEIDVLQVMYNCLKLMLRYCPRVQDLTSA